MSESSSSSSGVSFATLLALLFIGLKLGNVITWSWWWVLAPLWVPIAIAVVLMAVLALVAVLAR